MLLCSIGNLRYPGDDEVKSTIIEKKKYNPDDLSSVVNDTALQELGNLTEKYGSSNSKKNSLKYLTEQPIVSYFFSNFQIYI